MGWLPSSPLSLGRVYLIEQELMNALPVGVECATLLTRVEVDREDPAFDQPTKPIGPIYTAEEGNLIKAEHLWSIVSDPKGGLRRVVPSPFPQGILGLAAIKLLVEAGIRVICAGGGGIPVIRNDTGGEGRAGTQISTASATNRASPKHAAPQQPADRSGSVQA